MKRALIVDDEILLLDILEEVLTSECGIDKVDRAEDGLEAYHKAMSEQYDIICLDQMMPYSHGTEVLAALRKKEGFNKNTTILFISAFIPQIPDDLKKADGTFFLEKPVEMARLIRYVKMALNK
jgi:CheY-like chemotaxis protein